MKNGRVVEVNISDKKGIPKTPISEGNFIENYGLDGDAHAGSGHRQVSLLTIESINKMKNKGLTELSEGSFAENITTDGIHLHGIPVGTKLKIGETILEVSQIGKECHSGCDIKVKAGACVMPTEGVFAKVIKGGKIKKGDEIEVIALENN